MSNTPDAPRDEKVPLWPLVLGVGLLVVGAVLNHRLGHTGVALALAAAAVATPLVGLSVRAYLRRPPAPRVRRVFVDEDPTPYSPIPAVRLESAKYLARTPRAAYHDPAGAAGAG